MAKKKALMTLVWRITQTGPILSLFFWSAALAGIFWPIIGRSEPPPGPFWRFLTETLGIPAENATMVGLLLLFLLFAGFILFIGFVYDRVLKLWREQMEVIYERNPFTEDRLFRKEQFQFERFYLPLARAVYKVSPDPDLKEAIREVEDWVATGKIKLREAK